MHSHQNTTTRKRIRRACLVTGLMTIVTIGHRSWSMQSPAASPSGNGIEEIENVIFAEAQTFKGETMQLAFNAAYPRDRGDEPLAVVIYIHGGGYAQGDRSHGMRQARAMAAGGYYGVTIDYRLMQEARFPASLHDCKAAIRYLRLHASELGIDPDRIGVWGHSAGGNLSALVGTTGNESSMEGTVGELGASSSVQCVVDMSGPTDIALLMMAAGFDENGDPRNDQAASMRKRMRAASPMTYIDADDPPFFIVHGDADEQISVIHSDMLEKALREAGAAVEMLRIPGGTHNEFSRETFIRIAAFFDKHLGGNAAKHMTMGTPAKER